MGSMPTFSSHQVWLVDHTLLLPNGACISQGSLELSDSILLKSFVARLWFVSKGPCLLPCWKRAAKASCSFRVWATKPRLWPICQHLCQQNSASSWVQAFDKYGCMCCKIWSLSVSATWSDLIRSWRAHSLNDAIPNPASNQVIAIHLFNN